MEEFLKKLEQSIKQIAQWGMQEVRMKNALFVLQGQLVTIYSLYFEAKSLTGAREIATSPDFDVSGLLKSIRRNLPQLGVYPITSAVDQMEDIEWVNVDAAENLTRIIYELLVVEWHLRNSRGEEALWQFIFCFENYIKEHLSNLIYYLSHHHDQSDRAKHLTMQ